MKETYEELLNSCRTNPKSKWIKPRIEEFLRKNPSVTVAKKQQLLGFIGDKEDLDESVVSRRGFLKKLAAGIAGVGLFGSSQDAHGRTELDRWENNSIRDFKHKAGSLIFDLIDFEISEDPSKKVKVDAGNAKVNAMKILSETHDKLIASFGKDIIKKLKANEINKEELINFIYKDILGKYIPKTASPSGKRLPITFTEAMKDKRLDCDTSSILYAAIGEALGLKTKILCYYTHAICIWESEGEKPIYIEATSGKILSDAELTEYESKFKGSIEPFSLKDRNKVKAFTMYTTATNISATIDLENPNSIDVNELSKAIDLLVRSIEIWPNKTFKKQLKAYTEGLDDIKLRVLENPF